MKYVGFIVFLSCVVNTGFSANPASTAYVDQQIALAKADLVATINNNPAVAHPVGSCYGGGVVFYVNTTPGAPVGQRGLIAALQDIGSASGQAWYAGSLAYVGTSINLFTGRQNTDLIIAQPAGNTSAAYLANTYTDGVYHDWYLPAANELEQLSMESNFNANLFTTCSGGAPLSTANSYWSSSQYTGAGNQAWFVNLNGVVYPDNYPSPYLVRAIRAF